MDTKGGVPPGVIGSIIVAAAIAVGVYLFLFRGFSLGQVGVVVIGTIGVTFLLWWWTLKYVNK